MKIQKKNTDLIKRGKNPQVWCLNFQAATSARELKYALHYLLIWVSDIFTQYMTRFGIAIVKNLELIVGFFIENLLKKFFQKKKKKRRIDASSTLEK